MSPGDPLGLLRGGQRGAGQVDVAPLLHEHVPVPVDLGLNTVGAFKLCQCYYRHLGMVLSPQFSRFSDLNPIQGQQLSVI